MPVWKEDFFSPDRKGRMYYRVCLPENSVGLVLLVHGYAEHAGRYRHVMEYLAERGYASCAPDLRGHGRTARRLGDMDSFEGVLGDLAAFKEFVLKTYPTPRLFLLGHSLGGCLALCLSALHPGGVAGTISIAPMVLIPDYASPLLIALSGLMAALLPRLPAQAFPMENTCRDPQVLETARRDPLYYRGKMMARTGYQLLKGIKRTRALLSDISLPLLLLHGVADCVMKEEGSHYVLSTVGSRDKRLEVFDHLYHEILNEPEKERPLAVIAAWLDAHCG